MQANEQRTNIIRKLSAQSFDLLVVGGGITGAGVALDAAARGLSVALVEKRDFASGTSSKSTKLIHGGLRYLKNLEIGLVRETGTERAVVHQLAPQLVRPEKMLLPIVDGGSLGKFTSSMALWVYDFLADVEGEDKRKMLSKAATLDREPLLRQDILQGGGYYAEYRTDDARLTIENIKTARQKGAVVVNYVEAVNFNYDQTGHIESINCRDRMADEHFIINARHVISAAGPWVDELRKADQSMTPTRIFWSKGVHIVVAKERLPLRQAVYFDTPFNDNRMIFAIPRLRSVYIGTTDTAYDGDPNKIPTYIEDVDYLLEATNAMFPTVDLTVDDVESSWAGVRPLIYEEGKEGKEMSRKDEIFESDTGLLSIAGGKLTGYRKMAERVVDRLGAQLKRKGVELPDAATKDIVLTGGPFEDYQAVLAYENVIAKKLEAASLATDRAAYMVANYGKQAEAIIETATQRSEGTDVARLAAAEANWCIENELALYPMDFFERRSGRLNFDMPSILPVLDEVLMVFAEAYNYQAGEIEAERQRVEAAIAWVSKFESQDKK